MNRDFSDIRLSQVGYCTNVHAGADLATTRANLERFALPVKRQFSPDAPMGVGLWLSAEAARGLVVGGAKVQFAQWLRDVGLVPFTLNGFPYYDFHQPVVKLEVYKPAWYERARLDYTLNLIDILDALLPPGMEGSISTLPIAWGGVAMPRESWEAAANHLCEAAAAMARVEKERGRLIYLCIEPEPGCHLERSRQLIDFFREWLLPAGDEHVVRRHLRVCHDVCHAAVMFEPQADVLRAYHEAGILVGKVQVSSAIRVPFGEMTAAERTAATQQLRSFAEDRYMHQTVARAAPDRACVFYDDLPRALATVSDPAVLQGEWRIHFHVPVYLERFGLLHSSREDIVECLAALRRYSEVRHFEVETYAWGVLPPELRAADLASGIAREMAWFWPTLRRVE